MSELDLVDAYHRMALIRAFENHSAQLRRRGVIVCSLHLCNGHEAIAVGTLAALEQQDVVTATYRGHHWALACGTAPDSLFGEFMGKERGLNGGRGGAGYFADPDHGFLGESGIVGGSAPIGVGAALAARYDGSGRVAVTAFGDGALNQGTVHEAMNFAALYKLPVVFLCENNGYAEYTPTLDVFPIDRLEDRAAGYGIPGVQIDGADVAAVDEAVRTAAGRARSGEGPTLVVATTRRLEGHHTHDPEQYRPEGEKESWAQADPLIRLRSALVSTGGASSETLDEADAGALVRVREAAATAASWPASDPATVIDHVYG
jgi:TPP-dependent pyruvate/acetoin dehydrogenase alpha subunit